MFTRTSKPISLAFASLLALAGCGEGPISDETAVGETASSGSELKAKFTVFSDDLGSAGTVETRRTIKSAKDYTSFFGHAPPASVDFKRDWVIFYSAGTRATGGYVATVDSVTFTASGKTMKITTALDSPGPRCIVNQLVTRPAILVRVPAPAVTPTYVNYAQSDTTRDCASCVDKVACIQGSVWSATDCRCVPVTACQVDADCRAFSDYCTGCSCRALSKTDADPVCGGPGVRCFADPCAGHAAHCLAGACVIK